MIAMLSFCLDVITVGLVFRLELEAIGRRAKEHFAMNNVRIYINAWETIISETHLILIQSL